MNTQALQIDRKNICYVLAVALPLLVLAVLTHLPWAFGSGPFLLPLMAPVIIVALYGGLGPGLLATLVSAAGASWIIPPENSFAIDSSLNMFRLALLIGNSLLVTFLAEKFLRSKAAQAAAFKEVRESRQRFEATFQQAAVGMAMIAIDGRCLRANQKLCEILGYSEPELLDKTFSDLAYSEDLGNVRDQRNRLLAQQVSSYAIEQRCIHKDGRVLWVNVTVSMVRQLDGLADSILTVVEDISARKHAEHELKMALEAANDANSANLAKSSFLANMSHEIRTPLNAILGTTQLLQNTVLTSHQRELLDMQDKAGKHLLAIVSDVLDLSRIEAGKFELAEEEIDLGTLIEHAVDMVRGAATAKGLALTLAMPVWTVPLLADATCLRQALLNYLSNAIKFTASGTICVRVCLLEENADSAVFRFEVEDTGIGIAAENLSKLFVAFEQADSRRSRKYGGTGLGLVITQRLAALMGGAADARSTPGAGSTFWFTATLRKSAASMLAINAPDDVAKIPPAPPNLAGYRVLIVDDDPVNLQLLQIMVEYLGCQVDTANSGRLAVSNAASTPYDMVLLDLHMPEQSGIETVAQMRALANYRNTPIIAVTASAFTEDKIQALAAGFDDYITKPVDMAVLSQTLQQVAQNKIAVGAE